MRGNKRFLHFGRNDGVMSNPISRLWADYSNASPESKLRVRRILTGVWLLIVAVLAVWVIRNQEDQLRRNRRPPAQRQPHLAGPRGRGRDRQHVHRRADLSPHSEAAGTPDLDPLALPPAHPASRRQLRRAIRRRGHRLHLGRPPRARKTFPPKTPCSLWRCARSASMSPRWSWSSSPLLFPGDRSSPCWAWSP